MKKQTPKEKILELLKKKKALTITEMMPYFSISEIAVRKHLNGLIQKGYVKKIAHKQKVGRPYYTYMLTKKGHDTFPSQYKSLPLQLLQDLEEMQGLEMVNSLLERRIEKEKCDLEEFIQADSLTARIEEYVELQNKKGYMLEWKQLEDGKAEIINHHCPVAEIAENYSQVCLNEKVLLEEILNDGKIEFRACMAKGAPVCRWIIESSGQQFVKKEEVH
ncbi:transcriptional regulator [Compostibacillus humi]|uniref:Transcriptional regulator n=1 Tax=Compostibacillus humi TaxID=1245525 RepID=A0A8J2TR29_9BACI|nr:DeoR family transcriptional regulator [Compostibacillus humi]GFZ83129.1 transcriptional regulator [Compostibacillus humi]